MYNPLIKLAHGYPCSGQVSYIRASDIDNIKVSDKSIECKSGKWNYVENIQEVIDRVNEIEYINNYVLKENIL